MKPGALVVAIALAASACASFGGFAAPDLVATCWHRADAAVVNLLMGNGWVRPPDQDAPFHVPLNRASLMSWESTESDTDAAAIIERLRDDRPRLARDYEEWVVLSHGDDRMLLGGISSHGSLGAMVHATPSENGDWTKRSARRVRCGVRVSGPEFSDSREWHLDPQVEPRSSNSQLAVRFYEGCPDELAGWEVVPVVFTNDEVVMITMTVSPPPNPEGQFCNLGSARSWPDTLVDVGEPIGGRILVDGSSFPMQRREWPPDNFIGG